MNGFASLGIWIKHQLNSLEDLVIDYYFIYFFKSPEPPIEIFYDPETQITPDCGIETLCIRYGIRRSLARCWADIRHSQSDFLFCSRMVSPYNVWMLDRKKSKRISACCSSSSGFGIMWRCTTSGGLSTEASVCASPSAFTGILIWYNITHGKDCFPFPEKRH